MIYERNQPYAVAADSTAARLSWNPTPELSLQASWADITSPEALEPELDETRWSASAIYTVPVGDAGWWSTTAAWGRKIAGHHASDVFSLESAVKPTEGLTLYARAERVETSELHGASHAPGAAPGLHGPQETVHKASFGAVHDWRVSRYAKLGFGAGMLIWGLLGSHFSDAAGAKLGFTPTEADKAELERLTPKIHVVSRDKP